MLFVGIEKFRAPKLRIAEKILLSGAAAGGGEPLDVVEIADVVERWIIKAGMRRGRGHDRRQVRRKLFCRCPLIESSIGTAPHRDFSVTERLLREPFDDVVTIARFIGKRLKVAAGISATANIDEREHVAVRREVSSARMIAVGDVGGQCEDDGSVRR